MRRYQLKAARPACLPQSLTHRFVSDLVECMRGCDRQGRVVGLVIADKGQLQPSVIEAGTRD